MGRIDILGRVWPAVAALGFFISPALEAASQMQPSNYSIDWSIRIPLRDGVTLNANEYRPADPRVRACIFTLTPYGAHRYHWAGAWFASHGYNLFEIDARGRGGSGGAFRPFIQEAHDGYDIVEWLAKQPECDGKVATWGLSYGGYYQWATAKEAPPHLVTIVPVAAPYLGLDFPMRDNIPWLFPARFLSFVSSLAVQDTIFYDVRYWTALYRQHTEQGTAFRDFGKYAGDRQSTFQEWAAHLHGGPYWDAYEPTPKEFAALDLPILTITGSYDDDQPGALEYYRRHMQYGSPAAKAKHYLVIGPWDHVGTMIPKAEFGGLSFGKESLVDINQLHLEWYDWALGLGAKPQFLKDRVAYYVMGADKWRYAPTLEAVTARQQPFYLGSNGSADDVVASGSLAADLQDHAGFDSYVYDPRDLTGVAEDHADPDNLVDQSKVYTGAHKLLVYHSRPFDEATEISGFFRLKAWISIDRPDTSFVVSVYEIRPDGSSILLTSDLKCARYREGDRGEKLVTTQKPLLYDFNSFTFVSRSVSKGSRLRIVFAPVTSISYQRNYNSGKPLAEETAGDAQTVTVRLYHGGKQSSALLVPIGRDAVAEQ